MVKMLSIEAVLETKCANHVVFVCVSQVIIKSNEARICTEMSE